MRHAEPFDVRAAVAAPEGAPSDAVTDGVPDDGIQTLLGQVAFYLDASDAADTATVAVYLWSGTTFCLAGTKDITGSEVVTAHTFGRYAAVRLLAVSGSYDIRGQHVDGLS